MTRQEKARKDAAQFGRVPVPEFRSCKTTFITPARQKRERHGDHHGTRKTTQDGTRPGS